MTFSILGSRFSDICQTLTIISHRHCGHILTILIQHISLTWAHNSQHTMEHTSLPISYPTGVKPLSFFTWFSPFQWTWVVKIFEKNGKKFITRQFKLQWLNLSSFVFYSGGLLVANGIFKMFMNISWTLLLWLSLTLSLKLDSDDAIYVLVSYWVFVSLAQ